MSIRRQTRVCDLAAGRDQFPNFRFGSKAVIDFPPQSGNPEEPKVQGAAIIIPASVSGI